MRQSYLIALLLCCIAGGGNTALAIPTACMAMSGYMPVWADNYSALDSCGIYAEMEGSFSRMVPIKSEEQNLQAVAFSFGMVGVSFATGLKSGVPFKGNTSICKFSGTAHFRMYFAYVPRAEVHRMFMFDSQYSVDDFGIACFNVSKNKRRLTRKGVFWPNLAEKDYTIENHSVEVEQMREGVYDIVLQFPPGEYAFIFHDDKKERDFYVYDFTIV